MSINMKKVLLLLIISFVSIIQISAQSAPSVPNLKKYKIVIISGLSGSGKSTAIAALEDAGFFCVDNMPVKLLPKKTSPI